MLLYSDPCVNCVRIVSLWSDHELDIVELVELLSMVANRRVPRSAVSVLREFEAERGPGDSDP